MLSLKNLKLLVDLYQFLPSKKNPMGELNTFTGSIQARHTRNKANHGNFNTIQTPLENLQKDALEGRNPGARTQNGSITRQLSKFNTIEADMGDKKREVLRDKLN